MESKVEVKTYYTKEGMIVYLHQKIGEQPWEKIRTPLYEIPVITK